MIFVTLGTQDKTFERLLIEIDMLIKDKVIKDDVIVQAGHTKYESNRMKIFDFINMSEFDEYMHHCDMVITHGGVGSILNGINHDKKVIAVARLEKYKEHENDHQVQIINEFAARGMILGCLEVSELKDKYNQLNDFQTRQYESNNEKFCQFIRQIIDK